MDLNPEQKSAVREWVIGGASIADVQKRLREEHEVSLTYMDTRFLIDDLDLDLVPREPPEKPEAKLENPIAEGAGEPDQQPVEEDLGVADPAADGAVGAGNVSVEVDRLTRPGTVVSGTVTFSDGKSGKWGLDQTGRLVFEAPEDGYRPSDADLQEFQQELSARLQKQGF